ncbi:MAG: hypothetical protein ABUK15_07345 [Anaerolineales bacterium]
MAIRESPPPAQTIGVLTDNTGGAVDGTLEAVSIRTDKFWSFSSPSGSSGTFFWGGFYLNSGTANDFSAGPSFGTANASYAAHFFIVLGADTVDELTLTVTGTSINDTAVRTTSDTQNIVIPISTSANAYYETSKKWIGAVVITVASGTAKTCDFGFSKYWDANNSDFTVKGLEVTWLGGANDTAPDIQLIHHKTTGWTYTGSGATYPTALASMATDHVTEKQIVNNQDGAWKRSNLDVAVLGSASEGTLFAVTTTSNKAFEAGTLQLTIETSGEVNDNFAELATKVNAILNTVDRHGAFTT